MIATKRQRKEEDDDEETRLRHMSGDYDGEKRETRWGRDFFIVTTVSAR